MGDTRIEKTIRQNRKIARCARFLWVCLIVVACGSNSSWEQRFKESVNLPMPNLSVSPADPDVFSFAMVGDLHVGGGDTSRFRQILQAAQSEGDSFIVLLGDISDKGELESFEAVQTALQDFGYQNKVLPLLGNHDIFGDGWQEYKKIWGASHYTAVVGNSRFIVLDTADGIVGEEQWDWLVSEVNSSPPSRTFILSHYMPVVPGQRTYLRLANQLEAERLMNLASRKEITGFYGGHYHSYCQEQIAGVDYVVAGGGGGRRMEPVEGYFFIQVKVSKTGVQYELKMVP